MVLMNKLLKMAGKEGFEIDKRVGKPYIAYTCGRFALMRVRGVVRCIGLRSKSKVFVGKRVALRSKNNISIGKSSRLLDGVYIDALSVDGVTIGEKCVIGRNSRIECTGSLSSIGRGISIGDRSTFGSDCFFGAAGGITIGNDVLAGQNIRFHSENHIFSDSNKLIREQGVTREGIHIGNNCWIGAGAVFLDGSSLGDGCVVAANAVVGKKFPGNVIVGGVPAKVIKERA